MLLIEDLHFANNNAYTTSVHHLTHKNKKKIRIKFEKISDIHLCFSCCSSEFSFCHLAVCSEYGELEFCCELLTLLGGEN